MLSTMMNYKVMDAFNGTERGASCDQCMICGVNKRCSNSYACSRRCMWFREGRCPQCGKGRTATAPFCSFVCATTSVQANWCPVCAIRQCTMGQDQCSDTCALVAPSSDTVRRQIKLKHLNHLRDEYKWLNPADNRRVRGFQLPSGARVLQVVTLPSRVRPYLNYRAAVEQRLVSLQLPKIGHGGEGNELRRFVPLAFACMVSAKCPELCHSDDCEACRLLRNGFNLASMNKASHYATSTLHTALPWCVPNAAGTKAVAVVRAVIGFPQILRDSTDIASPWEEGYDSVTVTNGNPTEDGTYLFFDSALDLQYLVFIDG